MAALSASKSLPTAEKVYTREYYKYSQLGDKLVSVSDPTESAKGRGDFYREALAENSEGGRYRVILTEPPIFAVVKKSIEGSLYHELVGIDITGKEIKLTSKNRDTLRKICDAYDEFKRNKDKLPPMDRATRLAILTKLYSVLEFKLQKGEFIPKEEYALSVDDYNRAAKIYNDIVVDYSRELQQQERMEKLSALFVSIFFGATTSFFAATDPNEAGGWNIAISGLAVTTVVGSIISCCLCIKNSDNLESRPRGLSFEKYHIIRDDDPLSLNVKKAYGLVNNYSEYK
jgi:hypothetical protein